MSDLSGKVALVTGAGGYQGIGRAIALRLARDGADVAVNDLSLAPGSTEPAWGGMSAVVDEIRALGRQAIGLAGDVSDAAAVDGMFGELLDRFGHIDIAFNNAGVPGKTAPVQDLDEADFYELIDVNLKGIFLGLKYQVPHMTAAGGGAIFNTSSLFGVMGFATTAVYCASKGALIQLAKAMATDHAAQKIRVNTLSPGAVETDRLVKRFGDMETARRTAGPKHLLQRLGQPEEIAQAAVFLASDASSFMTGADLLVDGGYNAT